MVTDHLHSKSSRCVTDCLIIFIYGLFFTWIKHFLVNKMWGNNETLMKNFPESKLISSGVFCVCFGFA